MAGGVHVAFCAVLEVAVVGNRAQILILWFAARKMSAGLEVYFIEGKGWKLPIGRHVRTFRAISSLFFASRSFCNGFSAGVSAALLASWAFSLDVAEFESVLSFVASVD